MKKLMLLSLAITVFTMGAMAQNNTQRNRPAPEYPAKELIEAVNLTDEEVTKLKVNEQQYTALLQKTMQEAGQDFAKMQTGMVVARATRLFGIKQTLSDEKYLNYLEYEIINPPMGNWGGQRTRGTGNNSAGTRSGNGGNSGNSRGGNDNFGGGGDNFGGGNNDF